MTGSSLYQKISHLNHRFGLGSALLPLHVHDLCEFEIGRIRGEQASSRRVGARQANLRIDVEHTGLAAGGPHNRRVVGFVVLEVVLVDGPVKGVGRAGLFCLAGKVVRRLQGTLDPLLDGSVATVISGEDRVLETTGVVEGYVELAVLALLSHSDTWANGGNVRVEDEGDNVPVAQDGGAHSALWTSSTSVTNALDLDLSTVSDCGQNPHSVHARFQRVGHCQLQR